ncbi:MULTISPECIES: sugar transporter [Leuconostoc]|nr:MULTISPECIES: sugar transporter [Leuconostoc]
MKTSLKSERMTLKSKERTSETSIEKNRQDMSLKSMQFNRFMLIRYATAFFFFVNLYWALIMRHTWVVALPLLLIVITSLAIIEQIKLFGQHSNQLRFSKIYFRSQIVANAMLIISTMTPLFSSLFQFINNTWQNRVIVLFLLLLGILLLLVVNKRLNLISVDQDKYYARLIAYQNSLTNKEMK